MEISSGPASKPYSHIPWVPYNGMSGEGGRVTASGPTRLLLWWREELLFLCPGISGPKDLKIRSHKTFHPRPGGEVRLVGNRNARLDFVQADKQ